MILRLKMVCHKCDLVDLGIPNNAFERIGYRMYLRECFFCKQPMQLEVEEFVEKYPDDWF